MGYIMRFIIALLLNILGVYVIGHALNIDAWHTFLLCTGIILLNAAIKIWDYDK